MKMKIERGGKIDKESLKKDTEETTTQRRTISVLNWISWL